MFGKKAAQHLQRQGRYGDTMLAHINPREAAMLKAAGGSGTRNPKTGLVEFYDGDSRDGPGGIDGSGGTAEGGFGGGNGVGSGGSDNSTGGAGGRDEGDRGRAAADFANPGGLGPGGFGRNSTANASAALNDFYNTGGGFGNKLGNALAANFGFRERNPVTDPNWNGGPNAGWGFDPAGLAGGIAGMAMGVPGLGMVTDQISGALGRPGEIAMGPSVFGEPSGPSMGGTSSPSSPASPPGSPSTPGVNQPSGYGSDEWLANRPGASGYLTRMNSGGLTGYYS
jgi:hypothetical protein